MTRRFFIALQFLIRLPVPQSLNSSETEIGKAAAFFPLVGVIVVTIALLVRAFFLLPQPKPRYKRGEEPNEAEN